jgi:hypothetical protein
MTEVCGDNIEAASILGFYAFSDSCMCLISVPHECALCARCRMVLSD